MFAKKNLYWPLVILFIVSAPALAQSTSPNLSELPIEQFKTRIELPRFWATLSAYYEIPIGFQEELNPTERSVLSFKGGPLSEFLNKFVSENPTYSWALENGVIKIRPARNVRDEVLEKLLQTRVSEFEINGNSDCASIADRLLKLPETKRFLDEHDLRAIGSQIGGFYIQQLGEGVELKLSQASFEEVLDGIVRQSPLAKLWILKRSETDKYVYLEIIARQKESWRVVEPSVKFQNLVNFPDDESGQLENDNPLPEGRQAKACRTLACVGPGPSNLWRSSLVE